MEVDDEDAADTQLGSVPGVPKIKIRPVTVLLTVAAFALTLVGVLYITNTAAHLPSFLPGHTAGSTKHHYKHGMVALTLALVAYVAAWFTTNPDRPGIG